MSERPKGILVRTLAVVCHHCPICKYGRGKPESVVGKILHHRLHADYCPMWKAEKGTYGVAKK
jgi:hypothetical protein